MSAAKESAATLSADISDRLRALIVAQTTERRRSKEMEEVTGVPAANWKNFWARKQRPTARMIEGVAKHWPQFALWLVTGVTDEANGHSAPGSNLLIDPCARAEPKAENDVQEYLALSLYLQFLVHDDCPSNAGCDSQQGNEDCNRAIFQTFNDAVDSFAKQAWIDRQVVKFNLFGLNRVEQIEALIALRRALTDIRRSHNQLSQGD